MKWNDIYWIFQTFLTNQKLKNWACKIIGIENQIMHVCGLKRLQHTPPAFHRRCSTSPERTLEEDKESMLTISSGLLLSTCFITSTLTRNKASSWLTCVHGKGNGTMSLKSNGNVGTKLFSPFTFSAANSLQKFSEDL